jgi:DNA-binding HxlR family transcriptional regulator
MVTTVPPAAAALGNDQAYWDALSQDCPTRDLLAHIGDKWTVLVVTVLDAHTNRRFAQLRRDIEGISQKMLTQTLRMLERDGLVSRHVEPTVPVTVRYELTDGGRGLARVLDHVREWAYANMDSIEVARSAYDAR